MLKSIGAIALFTPVFLSLSGMTTPVRAQVSVPDQSTSLETLHTNLRAAVCQNDWERALRYISPIISSPELTARSRTQFIQFRQQLQDWRASDATVANLPNCDAAIAQANQPIRADEPDQPIDWQRATRPYQGGQTQPRPSDRPSRPSEASRTQCTQLGDIIGRADEAAINSYQSANFADISSLLQTMSQLATISDRAISDLRTLSLSDARLQSYSGSFASMYSDFSRSAREFVAAFNDGNMWTLEASIAEMERMANQGVALSNQVNSYCGWDVITIYEIQS